MVLAKLKRVISRESKTVFFVFNRFIAGFSLGVLLKGRQMQVILEFKALGGRAVASGRFAGEGFAVEAERGVIEFGVKLWLGLGASEVKRDSEIGV